MAADNTPIKPKLIKMSGAVKSSHGIKIIKGKNPTPPKETTDKTKDNILPTQKPEQKSAHIISTHSCAEENDENHNEILADSLKAHLSAKNQNSSVIDNILFASQNIGVNFDLMIVKAMIESDLGRLTKNSKSTASGLFQYIDSTWLTLLKRYGNDIGAPQYAQALTINPATLQTEVKEESRFSREELLDLRFDNHIASLIKAHQTKEDSDALKFIKNNGIITATDHYIAHMMGIPLAKEFYKTLENESHIILANSSNSRFEIAARLNPAFFKSSDGTALSAQNAYQQFHDKIQRRYDILQTIQSKYGNKDVALASSGSCNLPSVKTVKL